MADAGAAEASSRGSLATRLGVAFLVIALASVVAMTTVMLLTTRSETSRLSEKARGETVAEVSSELARAYRAGGGWEGADTTGAAAIAERADAVLAVLDASGRVVLNTRPGRGPPAGRGRHAQTLGAPVRVAGRAVGRAELRFRSALTPSESALRDRLGNAALLGAGIAILLALAGATLVARRLVGPLSRLTAAARRVEAGDLGARAADPRAPAELGELGRSFDRMAERLAVQERSRHRLVADLAHEVRTPISILRGNLEELVDGVSDPTPERLVSLQEEVLRLSSLIEQLDALAGAEQPVDELELVPVELAALAERELEALSAQLDAKGLRVSRRLDPAIVRGDRAKLGQVVANLLSNALKYTPAGGRIEVAVGTLDGTATLTVADTGPGIPAEERAHVFDRFWRGSSGDTVAGRGIGLAVAAEIVRAHAGTIAVDGEPGRGSRFTVSLPLDR